MLPTLSPKPHKRLDVLVPTFNRAPRLKLALESLLAAQRPQSLDVEVFVIDNNSTDATRRIVKAYVGAFCGRLHYLFEPRQGKSFALNTGISAGSGSLIGMIDDDEEIDDSWFHIIETSFRRDDVDFIGGPYIPKWEIPPPSWLPPGYPAVIGHFEYPTIEQYGSSNFAGMLPGGNAVIRRCVLERTGPYSVYLDKHHMYEDQEMYHRLLAVGARGFFLPQLIIRHHVPASRLRKTYFRRWCFWNAVSIALQNRVDPRKYPQLIGVPRFLFGRILQRLLSVWKLAARRRFEPAHLFSAELSFWELLGHLYARYFYHTASH
jgi:glycosyltransferase involved in cell wall biosynthesis